MGGRGDILEEVDCQEAGCWFEEGNGKGCADLQLSLRWLSRACEDREGKPMYALLV